MKSHCYRSLRKSEEPHYLSVIFTENDDRAAVSKAHCSCKGGSGGHCNHIFAIIFQLNDYSCSNVREIPSDATCKSLPQSWLIPRATSICPLPVMGTHYARAETDRCGKRKREPVRCKLYDARGPALKCYYDEKCCSRSLLILILYLAKMHHANYCGSISKTSLIFLTTISRLNCPPLPDSVPVELH